jgi:hypothetical protein
VFRDKTSLAVTPALWPTIQHALEASRYFILLASPAAAESKWVQQELAWWMQHRKPETLLIVLTAGTIAWDQAGSDFAWHKTDALPTTLSGWLREEPLWVDLRWAQTAPRLSHRDPQLRDDLATLAAPLRGVPKDDLVGLDLVLHRRAVRRRRIAAVLLVLLTLGAAGGGLVAWEQRNTAREQLRVATARQLIARVGEVRESDPGLALLLGIAAQRLHNDDETQASLVHTLTTTHYAGTLTGHNNFVLSVAFSPTDRRTLVSGGSDNTVRLWNVADPAHPRPLGQPLAHKSSVSSVAFSPDGRTLASGGRERTVRLWDLTELNALLRHAAERACSITGRGLNRGEWARYIEGLPYESTCRG